VRFRPNLLVDLKTPGLRHCSGSAKLFESGARANRIITEVDQRSVMSDSRLRHPIRRVLPTHCSSSKGLGLSDHQQIGTKAHDFPSLRFFPRCAQPFVG